jgi:hypothetical protein
MAFFTKDDGKTKTVYFGASGYQDYLQHHDKQEDFYIDNAMKKI